MKHAVAFAWQSIDRIRLRRWCSERSADAPDGGKKPGLDLPERGAPERGNERLFHAGRRRKITGFAGAYGDA